MSYRVQFEQWVAFPLEQVFPFFSRPKNLPRIMPPELGIRLERLDLHPRTGADASPDHEGMADVGSEIFTSVRILPPLPWRAKWIAQVVEFEWNHYFADVQKKGPFKWFHHRHEFAAVRRNGVNGTIVRDIICYEVGFGVCGGWAERFFISHQLQRTFEYRQIALDRLLAKETAQGKLLSAQFPR